MTDINNNMKTFNNKFNTKSKCNFKVSSASYLTDEQKALFDKFYKRILIELGKYYFQNKYDINSNSFKEIKENKDEYETTDIMLLEEIFDKGKKFYVDLFSKLYVNDLEKINNIFDQINHFIFKAKSLKESPEKYNQIYDLFELIGSYLFSRFKNENLIINNLNINNKNETNDLNAVSIIKYNREPDITTSSTNNFDEEKILSNCCA
ncbi:MAG: hypothetical protein ACOCWE_06705 [Bacillota bacterium]